MLFYPFNAYFAPRCPILASIFLLRTISISLRDKKRRKEDAQQPAGIEPTISRVLLSALPLCYNRCQQFVTLLGDVAQGLRVAAVDGDGGRVGDVAELVHPVAVDWERERSRI